MKVIVKCYLRRITMFMFTYLSIPISHNYGRNSVRNILKRDKQLVQVVMVCYVIEYLLNI